MTVLVATRQGIWADRRISGAGAVRYRPERKVCRAGSVIAAFCGEGAACERALRAVRSGEASPHALAELSDGLVVTDEGAVWELWDKTAKRLPKREAFAVHGSGLCEAQAFLSGAGDCEPATIKRAIRYVASVRIDCGDGCDARCFP